MRVLIIDDEALARRCIREVVSDLPWIECIGEAENGADAVRMINDLKPDLVFLDVELPELSGLEVLRTVRHQPTVIFTTAFDRYAVAAFELQALDYVLKPFGSERLLTALDRAQNMAKAAEPDSSVGRGVAALLRKADEPLTRIFVRDRGNIIPLLVHDIERLEAEGDYVAVHSGGRRHLVCLTLSEFERQLDPQRFIRVHRAHIVNLDFVRQLKPSEPGRLRVIMHDGTGIAASRLRSKALRHKAI